MKKYLRLIFIAFISSYSFTALSQDMIVMMKQQMRDSLMATCNDSDFLTCTGLSQKKCASAANSTISTCDHLFPKGDAAMNDDAFDEHGNCLESNFLKNTGISTTKLDTCDTDDYSDAPVDMETGITMMNQMLQQHAEDIGTDGVTLPIYKNATVMSHFASGEMAQLTAAKPLPAMVLVSPDNTLQVADYYRKNLKGFREHKIDGDILFMKGGPKDFDYAKDFEIYAITPHVLIMPMQDGLGVPPGTKSKVEIAYEE